jgi:hypothetical protein
MPGVRGTKTLGPDGGPGARGTEAFYGAQPLRGAIGVVIQRRDAFDAQHAFAAYVVTLANCADHVIGISQATRDDFLMEQHARNPARRAAAASGCGG